MELPATYRTRLDKIIEDAREKFLSAMEGEVGAALDPEAITKDVAKMLDLERRQITLKFLGFDARWGSNWEVDHCNGRESPVRKFVTEHAQKAAQDWLEKHMKCFTDLVAGKEITAAMRKDFKNVYEYQLIQRLRSLAESQANEDATRIHNEMVKEFSTRTDEA